MQSVKERSINGSLTFPLRKLVLSHRHVLIQRWFSISLKRWRLEEGLKHLSQLILIRTFSIVLVLLQHFWEALVRVRFLLKVHLPPYPFQHNPSSAVDNQD